VQGLLAFVADEDGTAYSGGKPLLLLGRPLVMEPGGRLVEDGGSRPADQGGRLVRPTHFLGRTQDGRLAYVCRRLDAPADAATSASSPPC
jgi:hypothetical protein